MTLDRFRIALAPRIQPEQRGRRTRLAQVVVSVLFVLLGLWLAGDIVFGLLAGGAAYPFAFDLATIAVLALGWGASLWLLRRGQIIASGYLSASVLFAMTVIGVAAAPEQVYLSTAGFLLAIVAVGAIVGGASPYLFALGSAIAMAAGWALGQSAGPQAGFPFDVGTGYAFLLRNLLLFLGAAAILQTLSSHMYDTVSSLQEHTDRLSQLAQTDALTGLANRRRLIDQLNQEYSRARRYRRPLSLLYLDLDGFKAINDHFGHMFGDDVLRSAAKSMRAVLRSTDLLARIGGDEFAVLLPETTLEGAAGVATKLSRALTASGEYLGPTVPPLTFCAGVSQLRESDDSIDDMLARADEAQYLAKSTGKAHVRTQAEVEQIAQSRSTSE